MQSHEASLADACFRLTPMDDSELPSSLVDPWELQLDADHYLDQPASYEEGLDR